MTKEEAEAVMARTIPAEEWMSPEGLEALRIATGRLPLPDGHSYADYVRIINAELDRVGT